MTAGVRGESVPIGRRILRFVGLLVGGLAIALATGWGALAASIRCRGLSADSAPSRSTMSTCAPPAESMCVTTLSTSSAFVGGSPSSPSHRFTFAATGLAGRGMTVSVTGGVSSVIVNAA